MKACCKGWTAMQKKMYSLETLHFLTRRYNAYMYYYLYTMYHVDPARDYSSILNLSED